MISSETAQFANLAIDGTERVERAQRRITMRSR
jgi:hypothetical protein